MIVGEHTKYLATLDRAFDFEKKAFTYARKVETQYAVALRSIARHIADIVKYYHDETTVGAAYVRNALDRYAEALDPWAKSVARKMIAETAARDRVQWARVSHSMRRNLLAEIDRAPIADRFNELMNDQVVLIKSLPLEAAQDVHDMVTAAITSGARPSTMVENISEKLRNTEGFAGQIEEKVKSRANLIARTESTRAATTILQARAEHIGSDEYIWRTAHDADVRPDHRILDGHSFKWNDPPIADRRTGATANPGCIYNCRCWAEPIISDE